MSVVLPLHAGRLGVRVGVGVGVGPGARRAGPRIRHAEGVRGGGPRDALEVEALAQGDVEGAAALAEVGVSGADGEEVDQVLCHTELEECMYWLERLLSILPSSEVQKKQSRGKRPAFNNACAKAIVTMIVSVSLTWMWCLAVSSVNSEPDTLSDRRSSRLSESCDTKWWSWPLGPGWAGSAWEGPGGSAGAREGEGEAEEGAEAEAAGRSGGGPAGRSDSGSGGGLHGQY